MGASIRGTRARWPRACKRRPLPTGRSTCASAWTPGTARAPRSPPRSRKAPDIAPNCGLAKVVRIERGVAYYIVARDPGPLSERSYRAFDRALRDRMTEVVVTELEAAAKLFEHYAPQPLAYIDVLGFGSHELQEANDAIGLALTDD